MAKRGRMSCQLRPAAAVLSISVAAWECTGLSARAGEAGGQSLLRGVVIAAVPGTGSGGRLARPNSFADKQYFIPCHAQNYFGGKEARRPAPCRAHQTKEATPRSVASRVKYHDSNQAVRRRRATRPTVPRPNSASADCSGTAVPRTCMLRVGNALVQLAPLLLSVVARYVMPEAFCSFGCENASFEYHSNDSNEAELGFERTTQ